MATGKYDEAEANLAPVVKLLEDEWTIRYAEWDAGGRVYADATWISLARLSQAIQSLTGRLHRRALGVQVAAGQTEGDRLRAEYDALEIELTNGEVDYVEGNKRLAELATAIKNCGS